MASKGKRPAMIGVLGVLNVLGGVLFTLAAFAAPQGVQGAALACGGILGIVVGADLFRLRPWARWTAIGAYLVNIVVAAAEAKPLPLVVMAILVAYLLSPGVKVAFSRGQREAPAEAHALAEEAG